MNKWIGLVCAVVLVGFSGLAFGQEEPCPGELDARFKVPKEYISTSTVTRKVRHSKTVVTTSKKVVHKKASAKKVVAKKHTAKKKKK